MFLVILLLTEEGKVNHMLESSIHCKACSKSSNTFEDPIGMGQGDIFFHPVVKLILTRTRHTRTKWEVNPRDGPTESSGSKYGA